MIKVLVTGSDGQLGGEIQSIASNYQNVNFIFANKDLLDITQIDSVSSFFSANEFDYCINCAALTNVDLAEEHENTYAINVLGVNNLVENCHKYKCTLIQISTDYVFDGRSESPYKEDSTTGPINYYGETKLKGERFIQSTLNDYFIVRTSWLYGRKGNNFVKTMLSLANKLPEVKVVADQTGSPTFAKDLAKFILHLIIKKNTNYGIFHFSNQGQTSWYDFTKEIYKQLEIKTKLTPISTKEYPTKAQRPLFSVLNTDKVIQTTDFKLRTWQEALYDYLKKDNY